MATVAEELPYAATVSNERLKSVCSLCFTQNSIKSMSRCSKCKVVYYCGSQCQKNDWVDHKEECFFLTRCAPRTPSSMARLMGRIILKMRREDPTTTTVSFNGRTLDMLMDHRAELQKDAARCEFFLCLSQVLYQYLGPETLPPAADILSVFGKIVTNCFTIMDDDLNSLGTGLYIGLSAHDHSCRPDAFILFQGSKAMLRTPEKRVYNKTLTISYTDLMQTNGARKDGLLRHYYFHCDCVVCGDGERDALSRSIRCFRCDGGVCPLDATKNQLVCLQCAQPQQITVDEAVTVNQEIDWILGKCEKSEKAADEDIDIAKLLEDAVKTYERISKILSPLNLSLSVYAQRILSGAFQLGRRDLLHKYAFVSILSYKQYLPTGHPELTIRLQMAAQAAAAGEPPMPTVLEVIEQAYESALLSHGPRHQLTSSIDAMRANYKTRLQNALAC